MTVLHKSEIKINLNLLLNYFHIKKQLKEFFCQNMCSGKEIY